MQMARKEKLCSHFLNLLTNSNISFLLSGVDTVCCSKKKEEMNKMAKYHFDVALILPLRREDFLKEKQIHCHFYLRVSA